MIDIHCHLLPGIDDGPDTLEQSLELCRIAVAAGITHAVVTPHIHPGRWENTRASIQQQCASLAEELVDNNIPLQLGFAAEVRLTDQIMQQIADNDIPFYGEVDGYNIMLLEFPHGYMIPGSENLAQWLLNQGIRPLIAHPERNKQLMKDAAQLQPFIDMGCWLQITAGSVTGNFGERAQVIALQLLDDDAVTVMASDGHNNKARQPSFKQAFDYVVQHYGKERAWQLMQHTPATIVADQFAGQALAS
ncbi:MAG: CpsB/CapC family capsule biosynthesis tyrosine phosphatase [Halioglobus sp.]